MKHYFLDTNIIIDFLSNREPFGKYALKIFNQARLGKWQLWASDNSITTTYYILQQMAGEAVAREKIAGLLPFLNIQPVGKQTLQTALISEFKDFEDAVQHFCAMGIKEIDGIVTRNRKDFARSQIPVFGPEELSEE